MIELLPVFEYLGNWVLSKAESKAQQQVEAWFTQKDFPEKVRDTVRVWADKVPYTVFVDKSTRLDLNNIEGYESLDKIKSVLDRYEIPEESLWQEFLREHRQRVAPLVKSKGESFYTITPEEAEPHIQDLARCLFSLCAQQEKNFRTHMAKAVQKIRSAQEKYQAEILKRFEQIGVAEKALKKFFKLLHEQNVSIDQWEQKLQQLAERYEELQARSTQLQSEDLQVRELQDQAIQAIDDTEFVKAEELLDRAVELDNAAAEILRKNYIKRKRSAADNQGLKAKSLHTRFAFSQAIESYKIAIELAQKGEDEKKVAELQWGLGLVFFDNAQYDQAIAIYDEALQHYLALGEEESREVAALRNNLGVAWWDKSEYDKAISYYEKALAVDLQVLGDKHPEVARDWTNLGNAWWIKGENDKAIEYLDKALAVDLKVFGDEHPHVVRNWNNLGNVWLEKGEVDKAIGYYEKALAVDIKVFGVKHPDVATDWNNLGSAWANKGEYDKAIEYFEKALAVDLKVFGDEHPKVATEWKNLGSAWTNKGEVDKAIKYYDKVLAVDLKVFGDEHPDVATDWNNLGAALWGKGEVGKAIEYLEKALAVDLKVFGDEHDDTIRVKNNLKIARQALMDTVE